jgi:hypothetical protein
MINVWIDPFSEVYLGNKLFGYDQRLNRDGILSPFQYLKDYCYKINIDLNTFDLWTEKKATKEDIYVVFNHKKRSIAGKVYSLFRNKSYQNQKTDNFKKKILFHFEPPVVHPYVYKNIDYLTSIYDAVFLVCKIDNIKCHYFYFPQSYSNILSEYWDNTRRSFLTMILSNKKPRPFPNVKELYSERLKVVNFFGKTNDIDLYGFGWDKSDLQKVYKGSVESKYPVLSKYNFAISFENCIMPGYITDRIFDCFIAGTIPVYWGAPDIEEYIPKECFIDMREFKDYSELRQFLKSLTKSEINSYKENARKYLESEQFEPYTKEHFAEMFVDAIR